MDPREPTHLKVGSRFGFPLGPGTHSLGHPKLIYQISPAVALAEIASAARREPTEATLLQADAQRAR